MKFAIVPAATAFIPSRARSDFREGASAPMPPTWIATELRLAKPHNAYVAITKDLGSSVAPIFPRSTNATNSFRISRVPSRFPTVAQSFHLTPSSHAMGAKILPRMPCIVSGSHPK